MSAELRPEAMLPAEFAAAQDLAEQFNDATGNQSDPTETLAVLITGEVCSETSDDSDPQKIQDLRRKIIGAAAANLGFKLVERDGDGEPTAN